MARGPALLVPFTNTPASLNGLQMALRIARGEKHSHIHAVYVVEVDRRLPLDADLPAASQEGERCLADAERLAGEYKLQCEGDILQARDAGHAIVNEAVELGVDVIVMGVPHSAQEGKPLDLGKTTEYVLRHAPCEVVVVRHGAPV